MTGAGVDYAIVGAGPAGLAVGIEAALAGRSAVVVDRRAGALDKACGEGLMPRAVARLREMGVTIPPDRFHPFRGIRYVEGGLCAEADFADGPGWGVRRTLLSEALRRRALELGVEVRLGVEAGAFVETASGVRLETGAGPIEARWLVGADGLHGTVARAPGFRVRRGARRRFGLRRHVAVSPWSEFVEVHWQDGLEAYVTPVSATEVGIAFLWTDGDAATPRFDQFLDCFPALGARLGLAAAGRDTGGTRGAGPFAIEVRPAARGRLLLAGDAAGYVDAVTGEGIGIAFAAARALVRATARDDGAARYAAELARLVRRHRRFTRALLAIAGRPAVRRRFIRALQASPAGFSGLLALADGTRGWRQSLPSLGAIGCGLVSPERDGSPSRPGASF